VRILAGAVILYLVSSQLTRFKSDLPAVGDQLMTAVQQLEDWIQRKLHLSTANMNELLVKKCYRLSHARNSSKNAGIPLYADVSKFVIKEFVSLLPLLKNKENTIFKISKEDMRHIVLHIRAMNTIAESAKDRYLSL